VATLRAADITYSEESVYASRTVCIRCRRPVLWMITNRSGQPLPFDPHALPVIYDAQHTGWAPGMFPIGGRQRRCMAPWTEFPAHRRASIANVLTLHTCRRAA
jgi:hypothetical protein